MAAVVEPPSISWAQILERTWVEANQDDVWNRAAQLSYFFFLSLFLLLICLIALLGVFSATGLHLRHDVLLFFARVLPVSATQLIEKTLSEVNQSHTGSKFGFGLLFSIWSASAGMSAMMSTLNATYEVQETRSFARRNAIAVVLTIATALLILAAAGIVVTGTPSSEIYERGLMFVLLKIAQWPVAIALVLFSFALIYFWAVPTEK